MLPKIKTRLLGCSASTPDSIPNELSAITHVNLFLEFHEYLYDAGLE
jgi:hypothetical protein